MGLMRLVADHVLNEKELVLYRNKKYWWNDKELFSLRTANSLILPLYDQKVQILMFLVIVQATPFSRLLIINSAHHAYGAYCYHIIINL